MYRDVQGKLCTNMGLAVPPEVFAVHKRIHRFGKDIRRIDVFSGAKRVKLSGEQSVKKRLACLLHRKNRGGRICGRGVQGKRQKHCKGQKYGENGFYARYLRNVRYEIVFFGEYSKTIL